MRRVLFGFLVCTYFYFGATHIIVSKEEFLSPQSFIQKKRTLPFEPYLRKKTVQPHQVQNIHFTEDFITDVILRAVDIKRLSAAAKHSAALNGNEKPIIVSFGSGGFFAEALLAEQGAQVIGIEPDRELVLHVAKTYDMEEIQPNIFATKDFSLVAVIGNASDAREILMELGKTIKEIKIPPYSLKIRNMEQNFERRFSLFLENYKEYLDEIEDTPRWFELMASIKQEYPQIVQEYHRLAGEKAAFHRDNPSNIDMVFNSYMPIDLNFRPFMDEVGASLMVMIEAPLGASGLTAYHYSYDENTEDMPSRGTLESYVFNEDELSYSDNDFYETRVYWETPAVLMYQSPATINIYVPPYARKELTEGVDKLPQIELSLSDRPYSWEFESFWGEETIKKYYAFIEIEKSFGAKPSLKSFDLLYDNFPLIESQFGHLIRERIKKDAETLLSRQIIERSL